MQRHDSWTGRYLRCSINAPAGYHNTLTKKNCIEKIVALIQYRDTYHSPVRHMTWPQLAVHFFQVWMYVVIYQVGSVLGCCPKRKSSFRVHRDEQDVDGLTEWVRSQCPFSPRLVRTWWCECHECLCNVKHPCCQWKTYQLIASENQNYPFNLYCFPPSAAEMRLSS